MIVAVLAAVASLAVGAWFARRFALGARLRRMGAVGTATGRSVASPAFWALAGGALAGVPGAAAGAVAALALPAVRKRRALAGRAALLEAQLPEALRTIATVVRAGHSIPQALAAARDATPPPLGEALAGAVRAMEAGAPLEEAAEALAGSLPSQPARLVSLALLVGRTSSADLPGVLDSAAGSLAERARIAADRRAATAQARFSAWVVAAMPPVFFLLVGSRSAGAAGVLFGSAAGWAVLAAGGALEVAGILWTRRLLGGSP